ncbi:MAG TPA: alpha/beta hydrolase [Miltoncostaeaceae bacterium]|nr:alpha/beta hydrolase [Miltoncostaeaceae bacterium]
MTAQARHHVTFSGPEDGPPLVFAHGFGCDQSMWRGVAPAFAGRHRVVLFDHLGAGDSDASAWDPIRHGTLRGYARDVVTLLRELALPPVVFVGHSVSAMIGVLAAAAAPDLFDKLVLVGASPRYVDDEPTGYVGGFTAEDVAGLLDALESDYVAWACTMAPVVMANAERPALADELQASFGRTDPHIAAHFARVTFMCDHRADLPAADLPTLVLQARDDAIVPLPVAHYVAERLPRAALTQLDAAGHYPHLSAPEATTAAIRAFV